MIGFRLSIIWSYPMYANMQIWRVSQYFFVILARTLLVRSPCNLAFTVHRWYMLSFFWKNSNTLFSCSFARVFSAGYLNIFVSHAGWYFVLFVSNQSICIYVPKNNILLIYSSYIRIDVAARIYASYVYVRTAIGSLFKVLVCR